MRFGSRMRGRPPGRGDMFRKPIGGRTPGYSRGGRGGGKYVKPEFQYREEFRGPRREERRPDYGREERKPQGYDNGGPSSYRDTRRPPSFEDSRPLRDDRRSSGENFRPGRESYRDANEGPGYGGPRSRGQRDLDQLPKSGGYSHEKPQHPRAPLKHSSEKRALSPKPLADDDLRKRLRRSTRSKSPLISSEARGSSRSNRPLFRGPEEDLHYNKDDLRRIQINILSHGPPRAYDEGPGRRSASPELTGDRGRPHRELFNEGPSYRGTRQAWDDDIALHRRKSDQGSRRPDEKTFSRREQISDRRDAGPPRGRGRGPSGRSEQPIRPPYEGRSDRGRFDSSPDRGRERQREAPRYGGGGGDRAPRGRSVEGGRNPGNASSYPTYVREEAMPMYDYPPPRRPY